MNRIKTGIKLQVTPEQSKQVQEICFANRIGWNTGIFDVQHLHSKYLFINKAYLTYCDFGEFFKEKGNEEVSAEVFIRTKGTCVEETPKQELKQNTNKEETMEKNEVKSYIDVKDYLIAKGLYERVLEIDWALFYDEEGIFSDLFTWSKTEEGYIFWDELYGELVDLDIYDKIESLMQDYKAKQGKESNEYIETQPEEVVETKPLEKPKQYLCYVQGKALPKHIHKSLEQAKQEAQRLCRKELAKVRVLEVVAEFEAEVLVKEVL